MAASRCFIRLRPQKTNGLLSPNSPWRSSALGIRHTPHSGAMKAKEKPPPPPPPPRREPSQAHNLMDIGIRRIFKEDHDNFRRTVRRFFIDEVGPHHSKWAKDGQVSEELWKLAGKAQLLGICTPKIKGGPEGDYLFTTITHEEQAYINCTGPGFAVHSDIVMPYIYKFGSDEQIKKCIPPMVEGTMIGAIAIAEPQAGSDLQGMQATATKCGTDYVLNGHKTFVSNGLMCEVLVVAAVTDKEAKSVAHGISLFLLDERFKDHIHRRKLDKIGMKAQDTCDLTFSDLRVPTTAMLGEENRGFYYLMQQLPNDRLVIASFAISACEYMFEGTRTYIRERKAFRKTLGHLQTVQHKLAEMKTEICIGRAFMDQCLEIQNTRGIDQYSASMAKYWLTDLQNRVAYDCLQLFGSVGYLSEHPLAKAFLDARAMPFYGGSNEIMKELIARSIVDCKKDYKTDKKKKK